MEVPIAAIAGGTRLALQVVSQRRRPALEVYANFRRVQRPEDVYHVGGGAGGGEEIRLHGTDTFVEFLLINIGGLRAEEVRLSLEGDFALHSGLTRLSSFAMFKGARIPQMAPAQSFPLFHIDIEDLYMRGPDGHITGISHECFTIRVEYSGPSSLLSKVRRRKYVTRFEFCAGLFDGILLPPTEAR